MPSRPPPTLRQRALQHLAQREHTRADLRAKLLRWAQALETAANAARPAGGGGLEAAQAEAPAPSEADVDALLEHLQQRGLLSDTRFVESRVHARAARYGNRRIEHELRQHGAAVPPALQGELRATEFDRAHAVWARKFGQPPTTPAERTRQMRFLAGRGFGAETIVRVLRHDEQAQDRTDADDTDATAGSRATVFALRRSGVG
jgi:regulatory protein